MAVLALGAVGAAAAAGATTGLEAATAAVVSSLISGAFMAVGAYIDQMYTFPAMFGHQSSQLTGPKISDIQLTTAMPGTAINVCFGRQNRVGGCVIWISKVRSVDHDDSLGGKGNSNVTTTDFFVDVAIAWCSGPINAVRKVWADGEMIYDNGQLDQRYASISHYDGTQETADPTIETAEGVGNVPAFVNTAYTVIENLALQGWGNRIPNFNALVEAQEQALLSDVVQGLWTAAGRDVSEIDTSWVRDTEVLGYVITGLQSGQTMFQPLMLAYDMVAQEQNGVIHFYHRKDMSSIAVADQYLAAAEEGTNAADRAIKITDSPSFDLPLEVDITYQDSNVFWQQSNQRVRRFAAPSPVKQSLSLPLTLDANIARGIAQRILYGAWAERFTINFNLAPSQLNILESDLVTLSVDGLSIKARVTSITKGNNYVYEVQATSEQTSILTQAATADIPVIDPQPGPVGFQTHNLCVMEIPILIEESYVRGYHYAVFPDSIGDAPNWKGGRLYTSTDNLNFVEITSYLNPNTGGLTETGLPDGIFDAVANWDYATTLTIQMLFGNLQSADERHVLAGYNHLYVGKNDGTGEVIAFCNALLTGSNTYQISKILRGRMGTEDRMTGHASSGEYAVLLDPGTFVKLQPASENIGRTIYYKAVPNNMKVADVISISAVRTYRDVWPFSPVKVVGSRDGSNNLTISWFRRSNEWFGVFDFPTAATAPEPFPSDVYDIHLYNNSGTLVRTIIKNPGSSYVYSAAQQTADGITPGNPVKVLVAQVNTNLEINAGEGIASAQYTV